jgi:Trk K+ transport system NAD-binding subunit
MLGFGGFRMEGDAAEASVQRQAKAEQADELIASTRDDVSLALQGHKVG